MDPLRLTIALGPLAAYLLTLGAINLRRRPCLIGGALDRYALAAAVSGMVLVGPLELLIPARLLGVWERHAWVFWLVVLGMYLSAAAVAALSLRPKLSIYNIQIDELRPVLTTVSAELDPAAQWTGTCLWLPNRGVELTVHEHAPMRHISLVSTGSPQSHQGWRDIRAALAPAIRGLGVSRNLRGASLLTLGALMLASIIVKLVTEQEQFAQAVRTMLRL